jgi:hypothetical protein
VALRDGNILEEETGLSKEARKDEAWDPEWIMGRFAAKLICGDCGDPAFVIGQWDVEEYWDHDTPPELMPRYSPLAILPPPRIIVVPEGTPDDVQENLDGAFGFFWHDLDAAGNRVRTAVERILDDQRVPKVPSAKNRRTRLTLHTRLERFKDKNADAAELLMAVKWIGNAGSHSRSLTRDDLMDGFDLIEQVLIELYSSHAKRTLKLAKSINRRRRPRGGRRVR